MVGFYQYLPTLSENISVFAFSSKSHDLLLVIFILKRYESPIS